MATDAGDVFSALKRVLADRAKRLSVKVDTPVEYTLVTKSASPFPQHKGRPLYFGSVRRGKAYVSLHLVPLYMCPLLTDGAMTHRPILNEYSPYLLDQMIGVVTASTLIAYIFYTISPETQQKFGTDWLGLTIPFPLYGIFRYLYLVHQKEGGGNPTSMLVNDRPLLACAALWVLAVIMIIYVRPFGM